MRQYVWVVPWWPSLSGACISTVYFYTFGNDKNQELWFESMTFLYSNPLMCRKRSALCFGAFPFDRHLEMHLQNGSVFCICSRAYDLSLVSSFGMASGVSVTLVISGVTLSVLGHGVRSSVMLHCVVLLLIWNAGPLWLVAESIWTVASLSCGSSTSLERQSAALFWAFDTHSKVMLYTVSSNPNQFTLLLAFFPFRNLASGLWSLHTMTWAPCR